jgi:hypothetical protein
MASAPLQTTCEALAHPRAGKVGILSALEQIRRMRGGSQAHLMRCADGNYYVVKFPKNPQGTRILANELLGARLAILLGLPVAEGRIVFVSEDLIRFTEDLHFELPKSRIHCPAGPCFGSRYQGDPKNSRDAVGVLRGNLANEIEFLGMLVFDKWTCNTDGRQVVYRLTRTQSAESCSRLIPDQHAYEAVMIDQGFCFNGDEWTFPDSPLRGRYCPISVYDKVLGMDAFEPWLTRLETEIDEEALSSCAEGIPQEWYGSASDLLKLLDKLHSRRGRVRELLLDAAGAKPKTFRNWSKTQP